MLEIRRGTAARSYENTFFRQFSEKLKKMFEKYNWDGLLIANSECEEEPRLQIDALLIAKNCICLIDFKNFEGEIILPQNDRNFSEGKWVTGKKVLVKGGSSYPPPNPSVSRCIYTYIITSNCAAHKSVYKF